MLNHDLLLNDVNDAQREAITHGEGPLLVIAGAGSGKTRVITRRIAYLISQGIHPSALLAITFTNKAAAEMRERVAQLIGADRTWISTFHSLGVRILRFDGEAMGLDPDFTIYDTDDQKGVIKDAMREAGMDPQNFTANSVKNKVSEFKNEGWSPEEAAERASNYMEREAASIYKLYQKALKTAGAVDFDDLLLEPLRLFRECPDVLAKWQQRVRYLLIDEYQDTNGVQYRLAKSLAEHGNICATGDPDQSIYSWRGADIRNILDFESDFPGAKVVKLELNYRSTGNILKAAQGVISNNRERIERDLYCEGEDGALVQVYGCADDSNEASSIARQIQELNRQGTPLKDIAVFYRATSLSRLLENALRSANLPYVIVGGLEFYRRKEVKDFLAYMRLMVNPRDTQSFLRVVNVPRRGIGKTSLDKLAQIAAMQGFAPGESLLQDHPLDGIGTRPRRALMAFRDLMRKMRELPPSPVRSLGEKILEMTDYRDYLREYDDQDHESRLENVNELLASMGEFDERDGREVQVFLAETALIQDVDGHDFDSEHVSMMTLHASKGLEFPVVFIAGVEEELLPHKRSFDVAGGFEEERRLFYVGMTRAREQLYLTHTARRWSFRQAELPIPSRFLSEIPDDVLQSQEVGEFGAFRSNRRPGFDRAGRARQAAYDEFDLPTDEVADLEPEEPFQVGEHVRHHTFGVGRVLKVTGMGRSARVTVEFPEEGVRILVQEYARLRRANA